MGTDETIELRLRTIESFFQAPAVDPFHGEFVDISGIDQLIDTMNARPGRRQRIGAMAIHLPASEITPDLAARLRTAINNYCNAQIRQAAQKKREIRVEGWKALRIGLIFWAICLGLSLLFEEMLFTRHAVGRFLGEGFIIAGWVGLWRPAELLLYEWWPYSREIRRYQEIKAMDVRIVSEPN